MRMRNIRKNNNAFSGRPVTAQRQLLLSLLRKAGGHITAKELYKRASRKNESISLATVYRTLQLFKELGLVEERRLGQVYCYYEVKGPTDHQHLVCRSCGEVMDFESPLINTLVEELKQEHGFSLTRIEVYMEGYCQRCKEEAYKIAPAGGASELPLEQKRMQKTDEVIFEKGNIQRGQRRK
jgi:Fe2+ or Zn2+ uptake regulation protein